MHVQFLLGRSGSGKTYACLEQIRQAAAADPAGAALILLTPEQATYQMEQSLFAEDRLRGAHRIHVVSFHRLAHLAAFPAGSGQRRVLSEAARDALVRRLAEQHRGELRHLSEELTAGSVPLLQRMIQECRHYRVTPEELLGGEHPATSQHGQTKKFARATQDNGDPLDAKVHDLGVLLRVYNKALGERFCDGDNLLELLARRCGDMPLFEQARLWVDGFAGFTPQQLAALGAMSRVAEAVQISLCLDPTDVVFKNIEANPADPQRLDELNLFHPIQQTWRTLVRLFKEVGCSIGESICFPEENARSGEKRPTAQQRGATLRKGAGATPYPRFAAAPALQRLEESLFEATSEHRQDARATETPYGVTANSHGQDAHATITIVEAAGRRQEVEAAALQIRTLCREKGYRYRDIAVILRDFAGYDRLLETIFAQYDIPFFLDRRRSLRHHPLFVLCRLVVSFPVSPPTTETMLSYLKTQLTALSADEIDALSEFAGVFNPSASHWLQEQSWAETFARQAESFFPVDLEQLEQLRREALKPIEQLCHSLGGQAPLWLRQWGGTQTEAGEKIAVRDYLQGLYRFLEELEAPAQLNRWYDEALAAGQSDQAGWHRQAYETLVELLEELEATLGDERVGAEAFVELWQQAVRPLTLGLTPPTLDQVLIGAIERSRHPSIRAALVLGFNEGAFPRRSEEADYFTDAQRNTLAQQGFELAPARAQRLLEERYLGYIALTRAREVLWVSYALADEQGRALQPSSFIAAIRHSAAPVREIRVTDQALRSLEALSHPAQLGGYLSAAPTGQREALLGHLGERAAWSRYVAPYLRGRLYANQARLDPAIASELPRDTLETSVSNLERFACCPFQHFARHLLKLEEPKRLQLDRLDVGDFYHRVLYAVFGTLRKDGRSWADAQEEELRELVETCCERVVQSSGTLVYYRQQSPRNRFSLEQAKAHLQQIVQALRVMEQAGSLRQQEAELRFGLKQTVSGLTIQLTDKIALVVKGAIDRVDLVENEQGVLGVRVMDYKSGSQSFSFEQFYHGLSLQLPGYLLVLCEHYQRNEKQVVEPVGLHYLTLKPKRSPSGQQAEAVPEEVRSAAEGISVKAVGPVNGDWVGLLDHTAEKRSRFYSFSLTKDGSPYNKMAGNYALRPEEMRCLLEFCRWQIGRLGREIVSGRIGVEPYRLKQKTPCERCSYGAVCRFDPRSESYRDLASLKSADCLKRMEEALPGGMGG